MTAQEVKTAAKGFGADLVGIAAIDVLKDLPPEINPLSINSHARTVIVLGRKVLRGSLRGIEQGNEFDNAFPNFGFMMLEDNFLAKTTYDVTIWMEARGFEAVPLFAYDAESRPVGVPVAPGKPGPNVLLPYRLLAQAAGLGETGLNGLFLTPEFGPRQRFAMLVSDAELDADVPFKPRLCDDCGACVKACPLEALDAGAGRPFGLAGHERPVAARNNARCLRCKNGAVQANEGRFNTVDRMAAACNRACIAALEARGLVKETFEQPFRQTDPWCRDLLGNKIS
jgi:ferredoxin